MNGQALYELWASFMRKHGCYVDPWDQLSTFDRAAWSDLHDHLDNNMEATGDNAYE